MRLAIWLALALVACGGPGRDVDSVLAAYKPRDRTIAALPGRELEPWRVGQWALYKVTVGRQRGYEKHSIVAAASCGFWIETVAQFDGTDRILAKYCVPASAAELPPEQQLDAVQAIMVRYSDRTVVVDFRNGQNPKSKALVTSVLRGPVAIAWRSPPIEETSSVTVSAGRFQGVARKVTRAWVQQSMQTLEMWMHPAVPIDGAIKATATDGYAIELLDFGLIGARSELPDFDEHLRATGLD